MVKPVVARADVLVDNLADNLLSDCLHETRFAAATDACYYLDDFRIVDEWAHLI